MTSVEPAGLLNINKPSGVSSFWVVRQVKRALGVKKVGHCGTLDPLADGVLLVVFGKATKLQGVCMASQKVYRTRLLLGVTTDTGDVTGAAGEKRPVGTLSDVRVRDALAPFVGRIEQIPPMYSALKVNGQRLYRLAREGIVVERSPRTVHIYSIDLLSMTDDTLELRVACSAGTYIRTLAADIGERLGCGATVQTLCREKVGDFDIAGSIDGDTISRLPREDLLSKAYSIDYIQQRYGTPADGGHP